jgi:peptidoglycan/LPS O-acetylase OafA/YrhL
MIDGVTVAAGLAIFLIFAGIMLAGRLAPHKFALVSKGHANEKPTLDGLRGVVAVAVVIHHSTIAYLEQARGQIGEPVSFIQNQLGSTSVALFFMVSSYLFCSSLIERKGELDLIRFFESRVLRIAPLYIILIGATVFSAFYLTGFELLVSPIKLLKSVARVAMFDFVETYDINTVNIRVFIGQIWSLKYEWMLYFTLPVLAVFMRVTGRIWPLFAGLILMSIYDPLFSFFLAGAVAAVWVKKGDPLARTAWQIAGTLGLIVVVFGFHDSRGWVQAALLTPFFVAVLQGGRWFSLLAMAPVRMLGKLSYGIYILHSFGLWIIRSVIVRVDGYAGMGLLTLTGVMVLSALVAIGSGYLGYRFVDRPLERWRPVTTWIEARKRRRESSSGTLVPVRSFG